MKIESLDIQSKFATELNLLLNKEWPKIGSFEQERNCCAIPKPIGVLIDGVIVGGLSFTSYKAPNSEALVVWVNTVFVQPNYRRRGIASRLIVAAQSSANQLFALTDIPELYTKIGWQLVHRESDGSVIQYTKFT